MRDRKRTYGQPAISQWLGRRKALRRFPPFFMNNSEYRSLLNNKKYEIAIENPINNEYEVLKGESISIINTNINQNYYEYNKKHYHDIINPKTLMPADNFVGVTVITNQIKDAFVLSKFIFLSSFENGKNLVKENKNLEVKWYIDENKIEETSNFNKYE